MTVAAEVGGRLLAFRLEEGDRVNGDSVLGVVDTVPLVLEREAVIARRAVWRIPRPRAAPGTRLRGTRQDGRRAGRLLDAPGAAWHDDRVTAGAGGRSPARRGRRT